MTAYRAGARSEDAPRFGAAPESRLRRAATALQARAAGVAMAAGAAGLYCVGWGRAFGWDASNTVGRFVATPSLLDPFRRQVSFNNQVLFSALEHVVFSATGSTDERVMRVLPIAFGAAAVGFLAWAVACRQGLLAGMTAGVVLGANPLALLEFREARGYSLLVLCAVVGTWLLVGLEEGDRQPRGRVLAYCAVVAVGVGTHLYGLAVLATHAAALSGDRARLRRWLPRWAAAGAAGLAPAAIPVTRALARRQFRTFRPLFPLRVAYDLLGGQPLAFLALAPLALIGLWTLRRRRPVPATLGAVAAMIGAVWLLGPEFLYSRFFIWLLPAVAVLVALTVARRPALAALVLVAVGAQVVTALPELGEDQFPNRVAAALVARAKLNGSRPCAIRSTATTLAAYTQDLTIVRDPAQLDGCDLVVVAEGPFDAGLVRSASQRFPYSLLLPAEKPGVAFSRAPLALKG